MSRSLRLHPAAQRELDEAAAYYDAESPGLGSAFLSDVDHALQQIRAFPEAAPVGLGSVRAQNEVRAAKAEAEAVRHQFHPPTSPSGFGM